MENKSNFWINWSNNSNKLKNAIGQKLIDAGIKLTQIGGVKPYGLDPYDELGYDEIEDSRFPKLKMKSEWDERNQRRNRFAVFDNNMVKKRFKVTEQQSGIREKGRFRTSGKTFNKRNANFSDLIIP